MRPPPWLIAGWAVFAAALLRLPASRHWLDAGEIVAAAHGLGITHPPGHPVAVLLGKAAALLVPFGSVEFRVALASALALAGAAAVAAVLGRALLDHANLPGAAWLSAAAATTAACCGPSLLQGVRAEVYALNALLTLGAVAALAHGPLTARRTAIAALLSGLGLANHHLLLAAGVLPALVVVVASGARTSARRVPLGAVALVPLGLSAYLLLPVRALADPVANWGDPRTAGRFIWTVSAEVFRRFRGDAAPPSFVDNAVDALFVTMDSLGPVGALVALVGLGLLARRLPGPTLAVVAAAAGVVGTKVILGFEPNNPDLRGYWLPAVLLIAPGAAAAGALLLGFGKAGRACAIALTSVWFVTRLGAGGPPLPAPSAEDARSAADAALSAVAPHGIVLLADFNLAFSVWASEAVEAARPDVSPVVRPFLEHPGYAEHVARRFPSIGPLPSAPCPPATHRGRPVHVELHHDLAAACLAALPIGRVVPVGGRLSELRLDPADLGSTRWLTWQRWLHALHREARGELAEARNHLDSALLSAPGDPELLALKSRLTKRGADPSEASRPGR